MLVNDADNEDDDEGDSNHLLSTNYVPSTKLGSLPILNYSVHCNQPPLASDEMEMVSKSLLLAKTSVLGENCQGALREIWKGFGVFTISSNSDMSLEIMQGELP